MAFVILNSLYSTLFLLTSHSQIYSTPET